MSEKDDAQVAIFVGIKSAIDDLEEYAPIDRANALQTLALAYRYAAGGQQPGASVIPS